MINQFTGEFLFLSNFYAHPVEFEGEIYPTNEHAFQAAKTFSARERRMIMSAITPGEAKYLGRKVTLRPSWKTYARYEVMMELIDKKFDDPVLGQMLLDTKWRSLIEGNHWGDREWGVDGDGMNLLGWMLQRKRNELYWVSQKFGG